MKLTFTHKIQETGDIWSFFFEPVEPISWLAGQSIRLEIPRKTWGVSERRFTIASAPHERHIRITTRLSDSEFKQTLSELEIGSIINGFNIEGSFVWDNSDLNKVFLAAGVGITPFRALISQAVYDKLPLNVSLIYSSRETPALFKDELEAWAKENQSIALYISSGRITLPQTIILNQSLVYISGPEQMVHDLYHQVSLLGVPSNQLKTDLFTGNV